VKGLNLVSRRAVPMFRVLCLMLLTVFVAVACVRTEFFTNRYAIGHDTMTYVNARGISHGWNFSNFATELRTPGYSLFFFFVTFGEIPNPDVIKASFCGSSVFQASGACDTIPTESEVVVRAEPILYHYSSRTDMLFERVSLLSRSMFVISVLFLYVTLSYWINPLLAAVSVAAVWVYFDPTANFTALNVLQTESLFPTLTFFYLAFTLMYLRTRSGGWLFLASLTAIYIFFVRPAFLYIPVLHLGWVLYLLVFRPQKVFSLSNCALLATAFVWVFWLSPTHFFTLADFVSRLARVGMFSDERTIDCIKDADIKVVLSTYLKSIYSDESLKDAASAISNDLDRYYYIGINNLYRLDVRSHPIYKIDAIKSYLDSRGLIPESLILKMVDEAGRCNFWRSAKFFGLVTAMTLGLTPQLTPHAPRKFFTYDFMFFIASGVITLALVTLLFSKEYSLASIILVSIGTYLLLLFIVALKQGGEGRYLDIAEPTFVLGTAIAVSALIERLPVLFASRRQLSIVTPLCLVFLALGTITHWTRPFDNIFFTADSLSAPSSGLWIRSATYGGNCRARSGNATGHLAAACSSLSSCDYVVDVERLHDPAPGCRKDYVAEFSCAPDTKIWRKELPAEAGLKSHLELSCAPAGAEHPLVGMHINSATYGANCDAKSGNVTEKLRKACEGTDKCGYVVDVHELGDPAPTCLKDFRVEYACPADDIPRTKSLPAEAGFGSHLDLTCEK
jgi:hypothetical protein